MNNRPRQITRTEAQVLQYQSQGSYPDGALIPRSWSLWSTLTPNATTNEYNLFGQTSGQSSVFDTNVVGSSSIPNGQCLTALGISVGFDPVDDTDANQADLVRAFYSFLRNSVWRFARMNTDFDAYFHGSKFLPGVTMVSETAGNRVGDIVRSSLSYKFEVPVIIGANTTFDFSVKIPTALGVANDLVVASSRIHVSIDGVLTKKQAG
jgi:hypothetical protein